MRKVYGIYGDNKCKREVNAIYKKVTIPAISSCTEHRVAITGMEEGLYLVSGVLNVQSSNAVKITVQLYNSTSAYEPEIDRKACAYYIHDDGSLLNTRHINYCRVIDVISGDKGKLDFVLTCSNNFGTFDSDLYFIKLK